MFKTRCSVCGNATRTTGQVEDKYCWNRCPVCGLLWQSTMDIKPPRCHDDGGVLPDNLYWDQNTEKISRVLQGETAPWHAQYDYIERCLPRTTKRDLYLEVGYGAGEMLEYTKTLNRWQRVVGFEVIPEYVAFAQSRGHEVYYNDITLDTSPPVTDLLGKCDVIAANEVMEHVVDPVNFLAGIPRYLAPEGLLWLKFARAEACPQLEGGEWYYWSATAIARVLEQANLRLLSMTRVAASYNIIARLQDDVPQVATRTQAWQPAHEN